MKVLRKLGQVALGSIVIAAIPTILAGSFGKGHFARRGEAFTATA
jgi:hypothetical protein